MAGLPMSWLIQASGSESHLAQSSVGIVAHFCNLRDMLAPRG